ncbi:MAG: OmpA family protein [Bacteroidia bacterium]
MLKQLFFCFLSFIFHNTFLAQNLIPDSSFENYYVKPIDFSGINNAKNLNWYAPTRGTTDYFCVNKDERAKQVNVPLNDFGYQIPMQGNCYVGFIAYGAGRNYREYLQTKLVTPLEKGKAYCLSFNFSLADNAMWQVNKLGILFSENEIHTNKTNAIKSDNIIYFLMDSISKFDTVNWISACYYFTAAESSNYLTLGGFEVDKPLFRKIKFNPKLKNKPKNFAYYYMDDVSLHKITDSTLCSCTIKGQYIIKAPKKEAVIAIKSLAEKQPKSITLKNILFEVDNYTPLKSSYKELDSLVIYLKENKKQIIEIAGHTDNSGNETFNKKLAQQRAEAIANYLIKNNIEKKRVHFMGYGSAQPLFNNDTEEHKKLNRRVEIVLK